eukprot:TRINITY_DN37850_c0_g1_i1.p1 TRINITY_DN37850_c0_g1~~TRINITY_DN37850_c0_g1_i1.p1  ORF type:complete len:1165 (+),score=200.38 TRINITY_DN37850_c0_g1_i1:465-3497(+)
MHALENPVGSLSTTFEAIQAVMKLAAQLSENMRGLSDIWAPPIYRRLLSFDRRERDMSERCLLKIKSSILPPTLTLSKVLAADLKQTLLPGMRNMLQDHGRKLCTIQAWGWYIRLLGSNAVKNRHLVNEMLKILEQTFSDPVPQVQIASVVAWEGLIDALIQPPTLSQHTGIAPGNDTHRSGPVPSYASTSNGENQIDGFSKSIKLIMKPLIVLISSKCDISVRSSCLNTWCYLLHKLDVSVNLASVIKTVLEPIFEVTFQRGIDDKNVCLWGTCVDLLYEFISSKIREGDGEMNDRVNLRTLPDKATSLRSPIVGQGSSEGYPIKWLPWDLNKLDFHLKMVCLLACQGLMTCVDSKNRKLAFESALKIFRTVLKGVQVEFRKTTNDYNEILLCISTILKFVKWACEDVPEFIAVGSNDLPCAALQFVEATKVDLDPSVLASPLYGVHLDLKHVKEMQYANNIEYAKVLGISSFVFMDMVSPMVFLTVLYLSVVVQSVSSLSDTERVVRAMEKYPSFVFSSYDSLENMHATLHFLYMHGQQLSHGGFCWLKIWRVIAKGLKQKIDAVGDLDFLKSDSDDTGYLVLYCLLCYPFVACYSSPRLSNSEKAGDREESCMVSSQWELELELVMEAWRSLYDSASCISPLQCTGMNSFAEGLCKALVTVLSESIDSSISHSSIDSLLKQNERTIFLFIYSEVAVYVLENIQVWDDDALQLRVRESHDYKDCSHIESSLELVKRFMMLSLTIMKANIFSDLGVVSRVFASMTCFVERLCLKQDIFLLIEVVSDPIVQWLSLCREIQEENLIHLLHQFWSHMLDCFWRIQPPIIFDSVLLNLQAPLLQITLDHPYAPISDATIAFWKSTYGKKRKLHFPQCLLPVLDKLSRNGRIRFHKGSTSFSVNSSAVLEVIGAQPRYRVTAIQQRNSKRVGFTEDTGNGIDSPLGLEKKRLKLAENQRKASADYLEIDGASNCNSPRVKTCKILDFTHGNPDLHVQNELRNSHSILKRLRKEV